jgi:hypothetical protein
MAFLWAFSATRRPDLGDDLRASRRRPERESAGQREVANSVWKRVVASPIEDAPTLSTRKSTRNTIFRTDVRRVRASSTARLVARHSSLPRGLFKAGVCDLECFDVVREPFEPAPKRC